VDCGVGGLGNENNMGESGRILRRKNGSWSGRTLAYGSTGFMAALSLMMILAPASGGAVHSLKVYAPAYKHTVSQTNMYSSLSGCAKSKVLTPKWVATTGHMTTSEAASASTCGKSLGYVGGSSYANSQGGVEVAFPFTVATNGNHSVASSWTVNVASSWSYSYTTSCLKNVNYNPGLYQYSYAYCEAGVYTTFEAYSQLQDLSNSSWYHYNYSYAEAYNNSVFENYTYCYNYGSPYCYNYTGGTYGSTYGYNEAGISAWTWNGGTSFTLWSNGTAMVKGHHYILILNIYVYSDVFAEKANLLGPWSGSAASSINLATLGNGATVNSVTIN
jgi:hypothetical protein